MCVCVLVPQVYDVYQSSKRHSSANQTESICLYVQPTECICITIRHDTTIIINPVGSISKTKPVVKWSVSIWKIGGEERNSRLFAIWHVVKWLELTCRIDWWFTCMSVRSIRFVNVCCYWYSGLIGVWRGVNSFEWSCVCVVCVCICLYMCVCVYVFLYVWSKTDRLPVVYISNNFVNPDHSRSRFPSNKQN